MPLTGGVTQNSSGGLLGALAGGLGNVLQQAIPTVSQIGLNALAQGYNPPTYTGGAVLGEPSLPPNYPPTQFTMGGGSIKVALPSPPIAPFVPSQPPQMSPLVPLQPQAFAPMSPVSQLQIPGEARATQQPMPPVYVPPLSQPSAGGAGVPLLVEGNPSTYNVPRQPQTAPQPPIQSSDPDLDARYNYDMAHGEGAYERDHGLPPTGTLTEHDRIQRRPSSPPAVVQVPAQPAPQQGASQPSAAPANTSTLPQAADPNGEDFTRKDFDSRYGPGAYDRFKNQQAQQSQGKGFHLPHIPGLGGLRDRLGNVVHNAAMAGSPGYRMQKMAEMAGRSAMAVEEFKQHAQLEREMKIEELKAFADHLKQQGINQNDIAKELLKGTFDLQKAQITQKANAYQQHQMLSDFLKLDPATLQGQQNRAAMIQQNPWLAGFAQVAQDPKAQAELAKQTADAGIAVLKETQEVYTTWDKIMQEVYKTSDMKRKDLIDGATVQADIAKKVSESASSTAQAQVDAATVAADVQKSINDSGISGHQLYQEGVASQWAQPNAQQQYRGREIGQAAAVNEIGNMPASLTNEQIIGQLRSQGVPVDQMEPKQLQAAVAQYKYAIGPGLQIQAAQQAQRALQGGVQQNFQVPPPPSMSQMQNAGYPAVMPGMPGQQMMIPPPPPWGMQVPLNMYPPQMNQMAPPPQGMPQGMPMAQAPQRPQQTQMPQPQGGVFNSLVRTAPQILGSIPLSSADVVTKTMPGLGAMAMGFLEQGAPGVRPIDFLTGKADKGMMTQGQRNSQREIEMIEQDWAQKEAEGRAKEEQKYLSRIDSFMTPQSRGMRNGAPLTDPELGMKFVSLADQSVRRFEQLVRAAGWSGFKNTGKQQPLLPQFAQVQKEMNPFYRGEAPFPAGQLPPGAQPQQVAQPPFPYGKLPPAMMGR